jgi:uncharacterized protein YggE
MQKQKHDHMRKIFILLMLISSNYIFAQTGEKNFIDQNYIEVIGKADMEVVPDEIYIRILINEKEIKAKTLAETESAMFDKLEELGFDLTKDLAVKDLVSNFQYYWFIKSDIILSKHYQLLTHDAKTAGKVFVELQKLGISNVSIDRVENSKITDYRREVKIAAIKVAREKAKALAEAIDQNIGRAIFIYELDNINMNMTRDALQGNVSGIFVRNSITASGTRAEPDIEFEKINLDYSISVRFELK